MGALLSLIAGACTLVRASAVQTEDGLVRVRDVISLTCIEPAQRARVGSLVVASLPANTERMSVDRRAVAALARRRVPALGSLEAASGDITFTRPRSAPREDAQCAALTRPLPAGAAIDGEMLRSAPCERAHADAVRFDRANGVLRAARDLPVGENLGRIHPPASPFPDAGDRAELNVEIGHTRIARRVEVLQAAPHGGSVFVRDGDGQVFAAPAPPAEHQR